MAHINVTIGPNSETLSQALILRRWNRPVPVEMTVYDSSGRTKELKFHVYGMISGDTHGRLWSLWLMSADYSERYECEYDAQTRTGYMLPIDNLWSSRAQMVIRRIQQAMKQGKAVDVIFKPMTNYGCESYRFVNLRPSDNEPLTHFCGDCETGRDTRLVHQYATGRGIPLHSVEDVQIVE